jgi:hypothetical protein
LILLDPENLKTFFFFQNEVTFPLVRKETWKPFKTSTLSVQTF